MELKVDPASVAWFKEEVGLPQGAGVRFLVKVYGSSMDMICRLSLMRVMVSRPISLLKMGWLSIP